MPDLAKAAGGQFIVEQGEGLLEDKPFDFKFTLQNFAQPKYSGTIQAEVSANWLLSVLAFEGHETGEGEVEIRLNLDNKETTESLMQAVNLSGSVEFKNVAFAVNDTVTIKKINGYARFNPGGAQLSNLSFNWLSSSLNINGNITVVQETEPLAKGREAPRNLIWLNDDYMIIFESRYPRPKKVTKVYLFDRRANTISPLIENAYLE